MSVSLLSKHRVAFLATIAGLGGPAVGELGLTPKSASDLFPLKVINLMDALHRSVEAERAGAAKRAPAASVPTAASARHKRAS
jgi:hypothetical protein